MCCDLVVTVQELGVVMASLQCEDLCGDPSLLSGGTTLAQFGSPEYFTPVQNNFCHGMPDPDLPASTATVPYSVPSSSVYSLTRIQRRSKTNNCFASDAEYFKGEASKDFWSEFSPEFALNQRGVEEINKEVEDDQMGRPVLDSQKRHKGLLGGITEFYPTV